MHERNETVTRGIVITRWVKSTVRSGLVFLRLDSRVRRCATPFALIALLVAGLAGAAEAAVSFSGEKKLNNLVSELLDASPASPSGTPFAFARSNDGWVFLSSTCKGTGTVRVMLDKQPDAVIVHDDGGDREAMRYVSGGPHTIQVEAKGNISVDKLVVKAIPELIHCGVGFNAETKA